MNQKLIIAKQNHEAWLIKNNVHPTQLKKRKKSSNKPKYDGIAALYYSNQSNNMNGAGVLPVRSIWESIRNGEESINTITAIQEKASRVSTAFNKGALQLIPKDQIIYSGKK